MKKYLLLKKKNNNNNEFRTVVQTSIPYLFYQNGGKVAKIDTLFMAKLVENHTLWGRTYP